MKRTITLVAFMCLGYLQSGLYDFEKNHDLIKSLDTVESSISDNCSCSDDTQIEHVYWSEWSGGGQNLYTIILNQPPSGYSEVELVYVDKNGNKVVTHQDIQGCVSGCYVVVAPDHRGVSINPEPGPEFFYVRARNSNGSWRSCNFAFPSSQFEVSEGGHSGCIFGN